MKFGRNSTVDSDVEFDGSFPSCLVPLFQSEAWGCGPRLALKKRQQDLHLLTFWRMLTKKQNSYLTTHLNWHSRNMTSESLLLDNETRPTERKTFYYARKFFHFPEKHCVISFLVCTFHPTTFFQLGIHIWMLSFTPSTTIYNALQRSEVLKMTCNSTEIHCINIPSLTCSLLYVNGFLIIKILTNNVWKSIH